MAASSLHHGESPKPRLVSPDSEATCWSAISAMPPARLMLSTRQLELFSEHSPAIRTFKDCGPLHLATAAMVAIPTFSTSRRGSTVKQTGYSPRSHPLQNPMHQCSL